MMFSTLNYTVLGVYLAGMVITGLWFARSQRTTEDYFLAGRRMPWLPVAMSMYASLTSAVTYMGLPGLAYRSNVTLIVVALVSPLLAPVLITLFYPFYRRLHVTTSYEYIGLRFSPLARRLVSALFLLARMGWLGTVIYAPAMALSVVTGMPMVAAILVMGLFATLYTTLGGLSAVLWTDLAQFVILIGGAVWVAAILATGTPGGIGGTILAAHAQRPISLDWRLDLYQMTALAAGISFFLKMMQDYGTDQVTVQRLLAVRTERGLRRVIWFNACTDTVIIAVLLFIGLGLLVFYAQNPELVPEGLPGDRIFPYFIIHQLPDGVSGLLIAAIFAAAMSSLDSGLNSAGTVLVHDWIRPLRRHAATEAQDVRLARLLTVVLGVAATGIAFYVATMQGIIEAFATFMSLFNAPVLVLFLGGMLTTRLRLPAWCAGTVLAVLATAWVQHGTRVNWVWYFPFAFAVCSGTAVLISLLLPRPAADERVRQYTIWGQPPHA